MLLVLGSDLLKGLKGNRNISGIHTNAGINHPKFN